MSAALWLCLTLVAAGDVYFFKWTDAKGNLFVTDRIDQVPAQFREAYKKRLEAAIAWRKEHPQAATKSAPEPALPNDAGASAYQRYQAKREREKLTKEKATRLREELLDIAAKSTELEQEQGELRTNPVMNIAVPARAERIKAIDDELDGLAKQKVNVLDRTRDLIKQVEARGDPESWVTNLD